MQSRLPLISYIYFPKSFLPVRSRLYNLTIQFQCTFTLMLSDSQSPCKVRLNNVNTFPLQKSTRTLSIDIKRQTRRLLITKTYFILFEIRAGEEISINKTYLSQVFKGKVCCPRHKVCLIWIKVIMVRIQKISEWTGQI